VKPKTDLLDRLDAASAATRRELAERARAERRVNDNPLVQRIDRMIAEDRARAERYAAAASPGGRFCESPAYLDLTLEEAHQVFAGDDLADFIRLHATVNDGAAFQPEASPDVYLGNARGSRVASLVRVVAAVTDRIHVAAETSRSEVAAPTAYGVALNEASLAFSSQHPTWSRIGSWIPVDEGVLEDKGDAAQIIDQFVEQDVLRAVDNQIVNGNATGTAEALQFDGFINNSAIANQALSGDTRFESLVRAATTIRNAGFVGPITALVNPADAFKLLTDEVDGIHDYDQDIADVLGLSVRLSPVAPTGTAVVGDLYDSTTLYVRGLGLQVVKAKDHAGFFVEGKVAVKGTVRATLRIPRPSGIIRVTGFSA